MKTGVIGTEKLEQLATQAEFDVGRMATMCAISEHHLQRIFKKHFQCTPAPTIKLKLNSIAVAATFYQNVTTKLRECAETGSAAEERTL